MAASSRGPDWNRGPLRPVQFLPTPPLRSGYVRRRPGRGDRAGRRGGCRACCGHASLRPGGRGADPTRRAHPTMAGRPTSWTPGASRSCRSSTSTASSVAPTGACCGFSRRDDAPVVVTCHTVLGEPSPSQRTVLGAIIDRAARVVVMSSTARPILESRYRVPRAIIDVIPHGVPDMPFVSTDSAKARLGLAGRELILSFGLLGPGKGYESAIDAMASVARRQPRALLVGVGATHPDLVAARARPIARRCSSAGGRWTWAITSCSSTGTWTAPSCSSGSRRRTSSSPRTRACSRSPPAPWRMPLARASRSSRPRTPTRSSCWPTAAGSSSSQARRLPGRCVCWLLEDDPRRERLARRAYASGRGMTWPVVGRAYRELFERVARPVTGGTAAVPEGQRVHA